MGADAHRFPPIFTGMVPWVWVQAFVLATGRWPSHTDCSAWTRSLNGGLMALPDGSVVDGSGEVSMPGSGPSGGDKVLTEKKQVHELEEVARPRVMATRSRRPTALSDVVNAIIG